ncbi:uncharacterized protein LOC125485165 [Rhincodon typus]|uniref:uncharacterized protein LOC125485165 n=1 Tax=Rhincodon typus TaxID=259920 RepID=UPI00202FE962|nr:uncharacterized protein LOC125485165 [Rhincodon typus]
MEVLPGVHQVKGLDKMPQLPLQNEARHGSTVAPFFRFAIKIPPTRTSQDPIITFVDGAKENGHFSKEVLLASRGGAKMYRTWLHLIPLSPSKMDNAPVQALPVTSAGRNSTHKVSALASLTSLCPCALTSLSENQPHYNKSPILKPFSQPQSFPEQKSLDRFSFKMPGIWMFHYLILCVLTRTALGLLLGADLTQCSPSLVGNQWQEPPSLGCKLCHCLQLGKDLFQECETPMRPSAWPIGCERVRVDCNYTIVRTNRPDVHCSGWSYTSYKYLIRVTGFVWDAETGAIGTPELKQTDFTQQSPSDIKQQKQIRNTGSPAQLNSIKKQKRRLKAKLSTKKKRKQS